jgi:hypothetical protein
MPVRSTIPDDRRPPPQRCRRFRPAALVILGFAILGCSNPTATPVRSAPAPTTHHGRAGVCLDPTAADYDCAGGSGNGPKYVQGPVQVRPPDPFDLDADADGIGCERD